MRGSLFIFIIVLFFGCSSKLPTNTVIDVGDKEGLLDSNGDAVVKPIYKRIHKFQNDSEKYEHHNYLNIHWIEDERERTYAVVENIDGKFGVIDHTGKLQLKVIYESISVFINGFAKIELNNKFGLINRDFEIVLKPVYDDVQEFVFNTAIITYNKKYGCIDKDMNMKIKPIYDMIYLQQEGMKRFELDYKWGFVDIDCNIVAKPIYDYALDYSNGYAKVKKNGLWGFLDKEGNLLSKTIFTNPDKF